MSPKLPRITATECERAVRRDGWFQVRQVGSHRTFQHPTKPGTIVIPMHARRDIKPGTLKSIIDTMGLTVEEFRGLL